MNKVFVICGTVVVAAWIALTVFLWNGLEDKTEEVGKLEAAVSSVVETNDQLNNTIDTILLDKTKLEKILSEKNKVNIKLLEDASKREGVINETTDECLDTNVPTVFRGMLQHK